jgi:hypothetical protein
MASYVGSLDASLSTGNVAYTSVGFQPVGLVMWGTLRATAGATDNTSGSFSYGMTDGTTTGCMVWEQAENGGPGDFTVHKNSSNIYELMNASGTIIAAASFVQFDSDGFTLNWSTAAGSSWDVHFLAIGGADVSGVKVGSTLMTSTGSHAVTGTGFTPTGLITAYGQTISALPYSSSAEFFGGIGMTDGTNMVSQANRLGTGFTTARHQQTDQHVMYAANSTVTRISVDITSFDADGFTLSIGTLAANAEALYMAIGGASITVGSVYTPTSTGNSAETGVGFTPEAVLMLGSNGTWDGSGSRTVNNANNANAFNVGAMTATYQAQAGMARRDSGTKAFVGFESSITVPLSIPAAGDSPSTSAVVADYVSLDADGFTLNYTTTTTREALFYMAFAGGGVIGTFDNKIIYADNISVT